jgi:hypothetical protein
MNSHSTTRSIPWMVALCLAVSCKDDAEGNDDSDSSISAEDSTGADDDDADASATTPTDATADDDDDDGDDDPSDPDDDDSDTTDPETTDPGTTDPDDTGSDDASETGMPGDSVYEEPFDGANGSAWPDPWTIVGTHIIDAEIDDGRARMSGENNLTARLALQGFDITNAEVLVRVEYENWGGQGYGFYVRQNGGALQETDPPGQGYGVYAEGNTRTLGIWKEIDGVESPILEVPDAVAGGVESGVPYIIRFQCEQQGDTTALRAKMWREGDAEPTSWGVEVEDGTPELQNVSGSFANDVYNYVGTGSVWVHHVTITEM